MPSLMDTPQQNFVQPNSVAAPAPVRSSYSLLSILGIIFSIPLAPVGLVLSIIALVKIKHNPTLKGSGLASAGVIISSIIFLLLWVPSIISWLARVF
jgi:hypothetical protein